MIETQITPEFEGPKATWRVTPSTSRGVRPPFTLGGFSDRNSAELFAMLGVGLYAACRAAEQQLAQEKEKKNER